MYSSDRSRENAKKVWRSLSASEQLRLVRDVAQRRSVELQRKIPNVLSVGVGYRTRQGVDRPIRDEICLRFLVEKKWKRKLRRGVPPFIEAYVEKDGDERRCAIPTDVAELGRGEFQGAQDLGRGVFARPQSNVAGLKGAVCCLVRDRDSPGNFFLLGCHHVFTRSLDGQKCQPLNATRIVRRDDQRHVGDTVDFPVLTPPGTGFGMDAALAKVADTGRVSCFLHNVQPSRPATEDELPQDYRIYTPGGPLKFFFASEQFALTLPYRCGRSIRVRRVYESKPASTKTKRGDSGSALIADGTGILFGMHFYGTAQERSLAIPADELFRDGLFSIRIEIVVNHDP